MARDVREEDFALEAAKRHAKMTETPVSRLVLSLAGPSIVSMMVTTVYNTVDTWFVSQLGTSAAGAVSIVFALMAIYQAIGFLFGHGAGSNISVNLGSGHPEAAKRYASSCLFACLLTSGAASLLGLIFLEPLLRFLGSTETILPFARDYAVWIIITGPLFASSCAFNNILRYEGHSAQAMVGLMAGNVLNMVGDPILMFGLGLGMTGAGISTAIAQVVSFGLLLSIFRRKDVVSKFRLRYVAREAGTFLDIVRVGLPSLCRQGLGSIATVLLNRECAVYGDAAIAAMGIVTKVTTFAGSVAIGIGQGFQPVSAYNFGAKIYDRVRRGFRFTVVSGTIVMTAFAILFALFSGEIISCFRDDARVIEIGSAALFYQALTGFFIAYSTIAGMLFQSTRMSGRATVISTMRSGLFFIPMVLLLPRWFGLLGIELAQPCADLLATACCLPITENFLRKLKGGGDLQGTSA